MPFKKGHKLNFKGKFIQKNCIICNKIFFSFESVKRKTCSISCRSKYNSEKMKGNQYAKGNKLTKKHKKIIAEFMSRTRNQENNPNWKGGVARHSKILYGSKKYKIWRTKIFKRDNFTCQECGKTKCYIEAHHIKEWANYPKLRFKINNGITLCKECHNKTKKGCRTLETLIKYL